MKHQLNVQVSAGSTFTDEDEVLVSDQLLRETIGWLFSECNDYERIGKEALVFDHAHIAIVFAETAALAFARKLHPRRNLYAPFGYRYTPYVAQKYVDLSCPDNYE